MRKVELICDTDCPNVEAAREQLRRALQEVGQPADWQEWNRGASASPEYARRYGSPTILVDGKDVTGTLPQEAANCCRIYPSGQDGFRGVPTVEVIASALRNGAANSGTSGGVRSWLTVLAAVGVATLPNLTCPACWPAYAGLMSSIGLGFLTQTTYLLPLTVAFLFVAVGSLGLRARQRHEYGPFLVGLLAAIVVVVGKFLFDFVPAMYGGVALLIGASIWNSWLQRTKTPSCPACAEAGDCG
ncbi:MAG: hypothetical protein HY288_01675 [Planctomycetia bacterium]|nr:hypothetical protein [Planctomycetia bacterium]